MEIHVLPLQRQVVGHGSTVACQGTDLMCSSYLMSLWHIPTVQIKGNLGRSLCQPLLTAVSERLLWTLPRQALNISNNGGFTDPMLQCLTALMVVLPPTDFCLEFSSLQLVPIAFHPFTAHIQEFGLDLLQMSSERQWCDPPSPLPLAFVGLSTPSCLILFLYILEIHQRVWCAVIPKSYLLGCQSADKVYCYWNREEGLHVKASGRSLQTLLSLRETKV